MRLTDVGTREGTSATAPRRRGRWLRATAVAAVAAAAIVCATAVSVGADPPVKAGSLFARKFCVRLGPLELRPERIVTVADELRDTRPHRSIAEAVRAKEWAIAIVPPRAYAWRMFEGKDDGRTHRFEWFVADAPPDDAPPRWGDERHEAVLSEPMSGAVDLSGLPLRWSARDGGSVWTYTTGDVWHAFAQGTADRPPALDTLKSAFRRFDGDVAWSLAPFDEQAFERRWHDFARVGCPLVPTEPPEWDPPTDNDLCGGLPAALETEDMVVLLGADHVGAFRLVPDGNLAADLEARTAVPEVGPDGVTWRWSDVTRQHLDEFLRRSPHVKFGEFDLEASGRNGRSWWLSHVTSALCYVGVVRREWGTFDPLREPVRYRRWKGDDVWRAAGPRAKDE